MSGLGLNNAVKYSRVVGRRILPTSASTSWTLDSLSTKATCSCVAVSSSQPTDQSAHTHFSVERSSRATTLTFGESMLLPSEMSQITDPRLEDARRMIAHLRDPRLNS